MSRGLVALCLLAMISAPLVAQRDSAQGLAASLSEQADPGVIDPIDTLNGDDCGGFTSATHSHPLDEIAFARSILQPVAQPIPPRLAAPCRLGSIEPGEIPSWPSPTRARRLSWLQSLVI